MSEPVKIGEVINLRIQNQKDSIEVIAIILSKKTRGGSSGPPTYNVGFFNKWSDGSISGLIEIKDMCVWRYIGSPVLLEQIQFLSEWEDEENCLNALSLSYKQNKKYVKPFAKK